MRFSFYTLVLCFAAIGCSHSKKTTQTPPPATPSASAPAPAKPEVKVEPQREGTTCKRADEVRSVEIEVLKPQGCKVWYSKDGKRSSVASSANGTTHCEKVHQQIQKNLEAADFRCVVGKISQNMNTP